jgi:radical SAM family uncharacterized protein
MDNLSELLMQVQKPARYIGGEWNMVRKDWSGDKVKVLLAFPEVYEVGMSYLGLKILYGILNERDDCLCERVFSPWADFEEVLKKNKVSLFSLESRRAMREFDIIGISLAYELNYTNCLNLLHLGGIPVKSSERGEDDPIVIAGGPACYNPEPMSEFIDAFVIGDGEDVVGELIDTYKKNPDRKRLLKELAKIPGVYVPSLYEAAYNDDGTIKSFLPKGEDTPLKIRKRVVKDLNNSFYPADQLVPYIQIVHDRIMLEIMRGCAHACKFCQAGTTYRPRRERSKETIVRIAKETYSKTGYEEITLLSLSSGDHPRIREIIEELNGEFKEKGISISVPSLRIEDMPSKLPALISQVKKSGLTFAPEAGSECLRKVISKNIDIEKLMEALRESYRSGWRRVKLYFMIGLPTEKEEDLENIVKLLYRVSNLKREIDGKDAQVTASINAFIPKPHTPFQWEPMEKIDILSGKKNFLRDSVKSRYVEMDFHSFHMGYLEAVFARGDRRLSAVVYEAWRRGARFDGWKEHFNFNLWLESFKEKSLDPDFYTSRRRSPDEILPWDFIDIGFSVPPHVDKAASI